jgi:hypothetical protein
MVSDSKSKTRPKLVACWLSQAERNVSVRLWREVGAVGALTQGMGCSECFAHEVCHLVRSSATKQLTHLLLLLLSCSSTSMSLLMRMLWVRSCPHCWI